MDVTLGKWDQVLVCPADAVQIAPSGFLKACPIAEMLPGARF
jgi:hypothetical protein